FMNFGRNEVAQPLNGEIKVALLGDTEAGSGFADVLGLIKAENADVVMINGDFGYNSSPQQWESRLRQSMDPNQYFIIGSLGNHDTVGSQEEQYVSIFQGFRTAENGLSQLCTGGTDVAEGRDAILV